MKIEKKNNKIDLKIQIITFNVGESECSVEEITTFIQLNKHIYAFGKVICLYEHALLIYHHHLLMELF